MSKLILDDQTVVISHTLSCPDCSFYHVLVCQNGKSHLSQITALVVAIDWEKASIEDLKTQISRDLNLEVTSINGHINLFGMGGDSMPPELNAAKEWAESHGTLVRTKNTL